MFWVIDVPLRHEARDSEIERTMLLLTGISADDTLAAENADTDFIKFWI